jgi:NADPH:quinone reductase-like Zn-dependent oxidoreductase
VRAVRFHRHGGPEVLLYEQVPTPAPGVGEVLVEVRAAGVNNVDIGVRSGALAVGLPLPLIPGLEFAGTIAELGPGVEGWELGDPTLPAFQIHCGRCARCIEGAQNLCDEVGQFSATPWQGGYAEFVVAPAAGLIRMPPALSFESAATLQVTFVTAYHAIVSAAGLREGDTVLVNSVGSGIGNAAMQVAAHRGLRLIISAGDQEKLRRADVPGIVGRVDYTGEDLVEAVHELTDGRGVDAVVDCAGGELFAKSVACLATGGALVTLGAHGGSRVQVDLWDLILRGRSVVGSARGTATEIRRVVELAGAGVLRPLIAGTFPLAEASAAHVAIESRSVFGKLALVP